MQNLLDFLFTTIDYAGHPDAAVPLPYATRQCAMNQKKGGRVREWLALLLWVIFAAGLLVQASAPRLKVENNAFVLPPSVMSEGKEINPTKISTRQRRMQLLSCLLTVGGALGLGFHYRRVLVRPRSS
jgi:NhaP-type Na+/H+ or K+/H+ antiporter